MGRRWLAATGIAMVALLAAPGCSRPVGVDGDIANGWPAMAKAVSFAPAAAGCHEAVVTTSALEDRDPVACEQTHTAEAYHLGTLTGNAAIGRKPEDGSAGARTAYGECVEQARGFLGGAPRTGRLRVVVVWPSRGNWAGGSRWFRCDLVETDLDAGTPVARTGSLKGALAGSAPAMLRCFNPRVVGGSVRTMRPVRCDRRHTAEFVGVWTAGPDVRYADLDGRAAKAARGCQRTIARYAKVPDDGDLKYRSGWIWFAPSQWEWDQGERAVQCFLYIDDGLRRSVKGGGTRALPIKYG